ncbi:MAG: DinB family protein [Deltaproteobacteria bacterium]|nr:DinB family protein [Deltaproteobacteria bacterium]
METKDYILMELSGIKRGFGRALKDLTQQEVIWRPASGCNSMGLILLHVARSEDSFIQARIQGKPQVWVAEKWYEKMNLSAEDTGSHLTVDQVNCFPVPGQKDILDYYDAVRDQTKNYLKGIPPDELDKKVSMPPFGDLTIAAILSIIVNHSAQHIGEISYLRGMLRGMDK